MRRLILAPERLKQASVRIEGFKEYEDSKAEEGSGFLINGNKILTARHVVVRKTNVPTDFSQKITVNITFNSVNNKEWTSEAILIADDFDSDIALLELVNPPNYTIHALPLTIETPQYNARFSTYGYPSLKNVGGLFYGDIIQTNIEDKHDIELKCLDLKNWEGLSGSPLVVNKQVCGIIRYQEKPYLHAVSMAKIKVFLEKNDIEFDDGTDKYDIEELVPNQSVFEALETTISTHRNGFFLLSGSPGTGKTTTVRQFKPTSKKIIVCGHYLVNDGSTTPAARSSRENLLEWLELICVGQKSPKSDSDTEKRIEQLPSYLEDLAYSHREKGETAVIFIDGLDDVTNLSTSSLSLFLSILPQKLPNNLAIVFSCTSKEILPNKLAASIDERREIRVLPLDIGECTQYILNQLADLESYEAQMLAARSEGHPLYLRYLIRYIQTQEDVSNLNSWVNNIPIIHGEIKTYYEEVWSKIKDNSDKVWTALTVAQLRQPVSEEVLRGILPEAIRLTFHSHFPKLSYLFKNERLISIYHASFREFISDKVQTSIQEAHDNIAEYCAQNRETEYSIAHRIYHFIHSRKPERAVSACTQTWADACAWHDIEPDLVLYDIQQVQGVCIDLNKTIELIRVKLLLARISFRYNMVFKENVFELAEALIAIGRPKAALKYILRGDEFLINENESLILLQKLHEEDADEEAGVLFNAIRDRIGLKVEEANEVGNIEHGTLIYHLNSLSLMLSLSFDEAFLRFNRGLELLELMESKSINKDSAIKKIKEFTSAYHYAYLLWEFDWYNDMHTLEIQFEEYGIKMEKHWTRILALLFICYSEFEQNSGKKSLTENFYKLLSDVEYAIEKYGYDLGSISLLIGSLIEESKRYDIVEKLIKESIQPILLLNIRKPNGVDTNYKGMNDHFNNQTYKGYIDTFDKFPQLYNRRDWENFLVSLVDSLGFITGKTFRLKAENRLDDILPSVSAVQNIVKELGFYLLERAHWKRSYALPEAVLPYIYSKITQFYIQFASDEIPEFIKNIEQRMDDQIGLFTEGVRESLFEIAEKLSLYETHRKNTFKILKLLETHIDKAVQNRWERTRDFIRLLKLYGKLKNETQSKSVYQKMLDTSMGPSWYKEDHLSLVNIALAHQKVKDSSTVHFQDFAGILDAASGEMTFQRYVRSEKEGFIGSLAKAGRVEKAIDYLKFQLLPSPIQIIQNAESSTIDAPTKGEGYILGAKEIIEPSAIYYLIEALPNANPLIRWAFCEVFVINEDLYRYVHLFATIQAQILNQLEASNSPHFTMLCERLTNLVFHTETRSAGQSFFDYLRYLRKTLNPHPLSIVKEKFKILHAYDWDTTLTKTKEDKDVSTKKTALDALPDFYQKAKDELEMVNKEGAKKIIKQSFNNVKSEDWDVWMRNWSDASKKMFDLLKQCCETDVELLTLLKPFIIEHNTEDWRIVYQLIELLDDKLNQEQTDDLLNVVKTHLQLMVRPETDSSSKYSWLNTKNSENTEGGVDEQLLQLLIWFLNHPVIEYKSRVIDTLIWLSNTESDKLIPILFEECLTEKPLISTELSAYILQKISMQNAEFIGKFIKSDEVLQAKIVTLPHFMIKQYFKQILISILERHKEPELLDLFSKLEETIPNLVILTGDVFFEKPHLRPIEHLIAAFNDMEILNGIFCRTLLEQVKYFSKPLSENEQIKAERYLKRSFQSEETYGYYDALLRYALNVAISPRISKQDLTKATHILELEF